MLVSSHRSQVLILSSVKMVIKYKDKEITTLEDIQKLTVKELRDILKCNSERAGGTKADLVLKVYALLMRNVVRPVGNVQGTVETSGNFQYDETLRQISALGWSTDLHQLPEMNFIQLYDHMQVPPYCPKGYQLQEAEIVSIFL